MAGQRTMVRRGYPQAWFTRIAEMCLSVALGQAGAGIKKDRPGLIINTDAFGKLPLKVIVPITEWKEHYDGYPWMVKIIPSPKNNLSKKTA
jgi:mRNA-degrading endonuclease toxin of MazEF toxin-antitoxin module